MKTLLLFRSGLSNMFLLILLLCSSFFMKAQEITYGDSVSFGSGIVKGWVKTDASDKPASNGIMLTEDALTDLPHESTMAHLELPNVSPGNLFDHILLNWNPHGHPPEGIYDSAHLDVHFFMISKEERMAIPGGPDPVTVESRFVPADYVSDPGGVPQMGTHWVDTTSGEFHGEYFTQTFILGYARGKMCFYEPMITKAWLKSNPDFSGIIKQPSDFQQSGYYPSTYKIYFDSVSHAYHVELTDFVKQHAAITDVPAEGLQLWLKADAGVMVGESEVNRWMDQSGNENDAIQYDPSRQPLLIANELNGKSVIRFDGGDDRLGFTGSEPMNQISLFMVFKNKSGVQLPPPNLPGFVLNFGPSGIFNAEEHMAFKMRGFDDDDHTINIGTGDPSGLVKAKATNIATYDEWRNICLVRDQTVFNTSLYWNGNEADIEQVGFNTPVSVALGDSTGSGGGIGSTDNFPGLGRVVARCDIAELIVYDTVLSDAGKLAIMNYLNEKYDLEIVTGIDNRAKRNITEARTLVQHYPNPFSVSTTVTYSVSVASMVRLQVYDFLGREVVTLVNERQPEGNYSVEFNRGNLPGGIYYYRLTAGGSSETQKIMITD